MILTAKQNLKRLLVWCGIALLWIGCGCSACGGGHSTTISPTEHSVNLSWAASTTPNVQYNVYRGTQHLGPYPTKLNSTPQSNTSFTDSSVQNGVTYYYVVTSIDGNSGESDYSNEAQATIPAS